MNRKVILLFGGNSDERLVSVASAQAMAEAISADRLWFWHHQGPIFDIDYQQLINHKEPFTSDFKPTSHPIFDNMTSAITSNLADDSVFLLGLHGGSGENGTIQSLFERYGRPYTASVAKASHLAFDKVATKEGLKTCHIKMAPHKIIGADVMGDLQQFYRSHGDMVIKPNCGGSSINTFFVRSSSDLDTVAEKIKALPSEIFLAEKLISGREVSVGVIDGPNGPQGLPATEIVVDANHHFDYLGKYLGVGTKEITPAPLSAQLMHDAQRISVTAHSALSLSGYSRTDLIMATDGFYFLEINTLPGLTKQSMVPQQLSVAGISMRGFLLMQLELAIARISKP